MTRGGLQPIRSLTGGYDVTTRWRNVLAVTLIILGLFWAAMSALGASMAARSIDTLTEMVLPASIGVVVAIIGLFMVKTR